MKRDRKTCDKMNNRCIKEPPERHYDATKRVKRFSLVQSAGRIHKSTVNPDQVDLPKFFLRCLLFLEVQKRSPSDTSTTNLKQVEVIPQGNLQTLYSGIVPAAG